MSQFTPAGYCRRCNVHRDRHSPCEGTIAATYGKNNPMVRWLAEHAPAALQEKAVTALDEWDSAREE